MRHRQGNIRKLLEAKVPQRDLVMVEKGKQELYSTLYTLSRALFYSTTVSLVLYSVTEIQPEYGDEQADAGRDG